MPRHMGMIDSDAVVGRHEKLYAEMPTKYRIEDRPVPLHRRLWRWLQQWVRSLRG